VLTESGLLPGALMRNSNLKFVCKNIKLNVETSSSNFTSCYSKNEIIDTPIAHHDGNYNADQNTLDELKNEDRIAFSYVNNPNGSMNNIAGILSNNRRVLGMMPHPERLNDPMLGGLDGNRLFQSLSESLVTS
jgi:phosphoribosylformylglycinamidine synthase